MTARSLLRAPARQALLASVFLGALAASSAAQNKTASQLEALFLKRTFTSTSPAVTIAYRLHVPENYDPTRKYPVVMTLHGVGERGSDNSAQLTREELAQPWVRDSVQAKHPHFVIVPQCPSTGGQYWWPWGNWAGSWNGAWSGTRSNANAGLVGILDSLKREFSLDTTRFYIAGLSMGGFGTFELMKWNPTLFAAAVPTAGGADTGAFAITAMAQTPAWIFHGAADPTISATAGSRKIVTKIEAQRGLPAVRFTSSANQANPTAISLDSLRKAVYEDRADLIYSEITGGNHASGWLEAWRHPMLTDWVFSKRKVDGVTTSLSPAVSPARPLAAAPVKIVMRGGAPLLEKTSYGRTTLFTLQGKRVLEAMR